MIALLTELAENVEDKQFQLTFTNEKKQMCMFVHVLLCCYRVIELQFVNT